MFTFSLLNIGCTRVLDTAIAEERARYAAERVDFHDYFDFTTVAEIQRLLRGEPAQHELTGSRAEIVETLLIAQQRSPHQLWTLLLIQAHEAKLVERRRSLSDAEDPVLDGFVLQTFVGALDYIPAWVFERDIKGRILRGSGAALSKTMRRARKAITEPPMSGVVCTGDEAPSLADLTDLTAPSGVA